MEQLPPGVEPDARWGPVSALLGLGKALHAAGVAGEKSLRALTRAHLLATAGEQRHPLQEAIEAVMEFDLVSRRAAR